MWGVRHQKISCNDTQNNKSEGGQGTFQIRIKAGARIRFIIVSVEVEENNDDYIHVVYEDD